MDTDDALQEVEVDSALFMQDGEERAFPYAIVCCHLNELWQFVRKELNFRLTIEGNGQVQIWLDGASFAKYQEYMKYQHELQNWHTDKAGIPVMVFWATLLSLITCFFIGVLFIGATNSILVGSIAFGLCAIVFSLYWPRWFKRSLERAKPKLINREAFVSK